MGEPQYETTVNEGGVWPSLNPTASNGTSATAGGRNSAHELVYNKCVRFRLTADNTSVKHADSTYCDDMHQGLRKLLT